MNAPLSAPGLRFPLHFAEKHGLKDPAEGTGTGCHTPKDDPAAAVRRRRYGLLAELPVDLLERLEEVPEHSFRFITMEPEQHRSQKELYRCACILRDAEFSKNEAKTVIEERFEGYYRRIPEREITGAIDAAFGDRREPTARSTPKFNAQLVATLTAGCEGAAERLRASSPVSEPLELSCGKILDLLYPGDPWLTLGMSKVVIEPEGLRRFPAATTLRRSAFRGRESDYELIVPNPMSAPRGLTRDGKISQRCLANAAKNWTYQVIEFDRGGEDEQAALIQHLGAVSGDSGAVLRMVVHSGGKSLHAWIDVSRMHSDVQERFRRYAAVVGADPAMFRLCQFARMPNAMRREKGALQAVRYLAK